MGGRNQGGEVNEVRKKAGPNWWGKELPSKGVTEIQDKAEDGALRRRTTSKTDMRNGSQSERRWRGITQSDFHSLLGGPSVLCSKWKEKRWASGFKGSKMTWKTEWARLRSKQERSKGTTKTISRCPLWKGWELRGSRDCMEASAKTLTLKIKEGWQSICWWEKQGSQRTGGGHNRKASQGLCRTLWKEWGRGVLYLVGKAEATWFTSMTLPKWVEFH